MISVQASVVSIKTRFCQAYWLTCLHRMSPEQFLRTQIKVWSWGSFRVWSFTDCYAVSKPEKKVTQAHGWNCSGLEAGPSLFLFNSASTSGRASRQLHTTWMILVRVKAMNSIHHRYLYPLKGHLEMNPRQPPGAKWFCIAKTMTKTKAKAGQDQIPFFWLRYT